MISKGLWGAWNRSLEWAGRELALLQISPNSLTLWGVMLTLGASLALATGEPSMVPMAGILLVPAGLCDALDGAVARARRLRRAFGAFIDSTADRLSDGLVFAGLLFPLAAFPPPRPDPGQAVRVLGALLALGASFLVSYTRARAEGIVPSCRVGFWERGERLTVLAAGFLFGHRWAPVALLAILPWLTVVRRIHHTRESIRAGIMLSTGFPPQSPAASGPEVPDRFDLRHDVVLLACVLFAAHDPLGLG